MKLIDSETIDKKLTEFYMQQTKYKLESLKVQDNSKLKLHSSYFSFEHNIPNYLQITLSSLVLL